MTLHTKQRLPGMFYTTRCPTTLNGKNRVALWILHVTSERRRQVRKDRDEGPSLLVKMKPATLARTRAQKEHPDALMFPGALVAGVGEQRRVLSPI